LNLTTTISFQAIPHLEPSILRVILVMMPKRWAFSTILGGKLYTIGYVVVAERFPDYLQIAQTMIDSFQIINKQ
jgi:hypothetical protein